MWGQYYRGAELIFAASEKRNKDEESTCLHLKWTQKCREKHPEKRENAVKAKYGAAIFHGTNDDVTK